MRKQNIPDIAAALLEAGLKCNKATIEKFRKALWKQGWIISPKPPFVKTAGEIQNEGLDEVFRAWEKLFPGIKLTVPQVNQLVFGDKGNGKNCYGNHTTLVVAIQMLKGQNIEKPYAYLRTYARYAKNVEMLREKAWQKGTQTLGKILKHIANEAKI